jgi:hypothetical protein
MTLHSPNSAIIAEAEQLVADLKSHTGSPVDQIKAVRQLDKLRCLVHNGFDALLFQAQPVRYDANSPNTVFLLA